MEQGEGETWGHFHPKIAEMMKNYHRKFEGAVLLDRVVEAAGTTLTKLPYLWRFMENGENTLCYRHLLGCCTYKKCKQIHIEGDEVRGDFAVKLCIVLTPGVSHVTETVEPYPKPPAKKQKTG